VHRYSRIQHHHAWDDLADAQALHGLGLLCRGLPRVKADPTDLAARLDCQIGSWLSMGALAAGVPMGASHGIGYVLGRGWRNNSFTRRGSSVTPAMALNSPPESVVGTVI
jgi:alcohol dehydrogenase class IV